MTRRWAFLRIVFGKYEIKSKDGPMTTSDLDKTDWSPNRKVVAQATAMLILFVTGAILTATGHELDIPLGIETALAVVIGYFIPNKTRTVTTVESTQKTQVVKTEVPGAAPDPVEADDA